MTKTKFRPRSKTRSKVAPYTFLGEFFGVSAKTIRRWGDEFNYDPFDVSSFIRFVIWINKKKSTNS